MPAWTAHWIKDILIYLGKLLKKLQSQMCGHMHVVPGVDWKRTEWSKCKHQLYSEFDTILGYFLNKIKWKYDSLWKGDFLPNFWLRSKTNGQDSRLLNENLLDTIKKSFVVVGSIIAPSQIQIDIKGLVKITSTANVESKSCFLLLYILRIDVFKVIQTSWSY